MIDRERYSDIGHTGMRYWNPVSGGVLEGMLYQMVRGIGDRALDVGCGRGELLIQLAERHGYRGVGVDRSKSCIRAARIRAAERGLAERVEFRSEGFDAGAFEGGTFGAAVCLGASQAIGAQAEALRVLAALVASGGWVLFGDGYWRKEPEAAYLAMLGCGASDMPTRDGQIALMGAAGLETVAHHETTSAEWARYEDSYAANIRRFVREHPDDLQAGLMSERIEHWRAAYEQYGHATLGFGLFLLRSRE